MHDMVIPRADSTTKMAFSFLFLIVVLQTEMVHGCVGSTERLITQVAIPTRHRPSRVIRKPRHTLRMQHPPRG